MGKRIVVIGNGMAGIATVEAILKTQSPVSITVFGDEPYTNYNRILLSDVLAGKTTDEKIVLNTKEWYAENQIDLRINTPITAIDPHAKVVIDSKGESTPYDYLIMAVGGLPIIPSIAGVDKKGVMVFRTLDETKQIISLAGTHKEAVVIGGGLLGLEAARGLTHYGVSVTVVHLMDRLMEQQLDPIGAAVLKRQIERMGIPVLLSATATEIVGNGKVEAVRLSSGEVLPCGMVLVCTGIRPNLALAKAANLTVNRGILVNDRMETSAPGIFACGDVIEHRDKTYGFVDPIRDQAAVIADTIIGSGNSRYEGTICATTLKVAGVHLTSAGDFTGGGLSETVSSLDTEKGIYKKGVIRNGKLVGFILLGDNRERMRLFNLILKGENIKTSADIAAIFRTSGSLPSEGANGCGVFSMADSDLICNCNTVTKGVILSAITKKGLKTREQVAACTMASTGCGSCAQLVDDLIILSNKGTPVEAKATSMDTVDTEAVKQAGLGIDFETLQKVGTRGLTFEDRYRLKTYGFSTQKHPGYFMVRVRVPGGALTVRQIEGLVELSETHGRGMAYITPRQNLKLHWVRVEEALVLFEKLRTIGLTTRSSSGDTVRNMVACPHGAIAPEGLLDVTPWAKKLTDYYVQRSPLINPTLPSQLNVYFSACNECDTDAPFHDISFIGRRASSQQTIPAVGVPTVGDRKTMTKTPTPEIGFELWVGGSLGIDPKLGFKIKEFIRLEDSLPAFQAIVEMHAQFSDRAKGRSRLKHLIEKWGIEKFTAMFDKLFLEKKSLPDNREVSLPSTGEMEPQPTRLSQTIAALTLRSNLPDGVRPLRGVIRQRQRGYVRLTVNTPFGELRATQLAAIGKMAKQYANDRIYLTRNQNIEFHWVKIGHVQSVIKRLKRVGLSLKGDSPTLLACPGVEFCPVGVTNSTGAGRDILKHYKPDSPEKKALFNSISIHISGCENGCARHQIADIGFAGTLISAEGTSLFGYQLFLGGASSPRQGATAPSEESRPVGSPEKGLYGVGEKMDVSLGFTTPNGGCSLAERPALREGMIIPTIDAILSVILEHRNSGERFSDVVSRIGVSKVAQLLDTKIPHVSHQALKETGVTMVPDLMEVL